MCNLGLPSEGNDSVLLNGLTPQFIAFMGDFLTNNVFPNKSLTWAAEPLELPSKELCNSDACRLFVVRLLAHAQLDLSFLSFH